MVKKIVLTITLFILMSVPIFADDISGDIVSVDIDGHLYYEEEPLLINGATYVQYDEYVDYMIVDKTIDFDIEVNTEYDYIIANDRYLYNGMEFYNIEKDVYVPIRLIAKIFNSEVSWDAVTNTVRITSGTGLIDSGESFYDYDDVYWLSRIIQAESGGESFEGKLAVGTVIMNRVMSSEFPDTVYDVIFDSEYGVQFTPTSNRRIYNTPSEESVIAAKICLDGYRTDTSILYFLDESIATSKWIVNNRAYILTIGCHDFYS